MRSADKRKLPCGAAEASTLQMRIVVTCGESLDLYVQSRLLPRTRHVGRIEPPVLGANALAKGKPNLVEGKKDNIACRSCATVLREEKGCLIDVGGGHAMVRVLLLMYRLGSVVNAIRTGLYLRQTGVASTLLPRRSIRRARARRDHSPGRYTRVRGSPPP